MLILAKHDSLFPPLGLLHRPDGIQRVIDRRFCRRKYDAAWTLDAFSATLRNELDLSQLREHLITIVQDTMQAEQVSLWLRPTASDRKQSAFKISTHPDPEDGKNAAGMLHEKANLL